jgi:peptidoglycan/LPS O-acetylase OafA/YrhL
MTSPEPQGPRRSAALDGVRGLAALAVLVYHVWLYTQPDPSAGRRANWFDYPLHELRLGLVAFFVLSGFLLYRPWVRAAIAGAQRPRLGPYALRRAARLMPAYYLALVASVVLLWPAHGTPGVRLPNADWMWLFAVFGENLHPGTVLKLNPPMWTLAVEASFYVALPLLGWVALRMRGGRARQALVPLLAIGLGVGWNLAIAGRDLTMVMSKVLPPMLPYFGLGMLAALIACDRVVSPRAGRALLAGGALAVLANAAMHAVASASGSHFVPLHVSRDLLAAAGFAAIVAALAHGSRRSRWLASRPLAGLGTVSYGLYLWHVPLILWGRSQGLLPESALFALPLVAAVSLAVAALSWRWVERPVLARVHRGSPAGASRRSTPRRAGAPAYGRSPA